MLVCRLWVGGQDVAGNSSPTRGWGGICLCSLVVWHRRLLGTCMVLADLEKPCKALSFSWVEWGHQLYPLNSGVSEASVRAASILGVGCGAKDSGKEVSKGPEPRELWLQWWSSSLETQGNTPAPAAVLEADRN